MDAKYFEEQIFHVDNDADFERLALQLYDFQRENNPVFRRYLNT